MKYIKLIVLIIATLGLIGCSDKCDGQYYEHNKGSLTYNINDDDSINLIWNKVFKGKVVLSNYTNSYPTLIDIGTIESPESIISISDSNMTEIIEINCVPQLRTSTYITYNCNSTEIDTTGTLILYIGQNNKIYVKEDYLDINNTILDSNIIYPEPKVRI